MKLCRLIVLFCLFCLAPMQLQAAEDGYILGPGDVVGITVYDFPDLSITSRVNSKSSITFPLIGRVTLGGKTPSQAEEIISTKLKSGGFVNQPSVIVSIIEFGSQQVSILGQVKLPGKYPLKRRTTLVDILAQAGGVADTGGDTATLLRGADGSTTPKSYVIDLTQLFGTGDLSKNILVQSGDVIFVPPAPVFYVYGAVKNPGAYRLQRNMNTVQALSVGGGLTDRGTERGIRIERGGRIANANLTDLLQPNDVVYVEESVF